MTGPDIALGVFALALIVFLSWSLVVVVMDWRVERRDARRLAAFRRGREISRRYGH